MFDVLFKNIGLLWGYNNLNFKQNGTENQHSRKRTKRF